MGLWKDVFGESKREVWTRLASELGGNFVEGGWVGADAVTARLGGFDIVLDTYTVSTGQSSQTYTRMRAPFVNARGLRLHLHRASIFSGLAKKLGQQDISIGDPAFDPDFIIQGNDVERVKQILQSDTLKALLMSQPKVRIEVQDDEGMFGRTYASGVDVLHFVEGGVIRDDRRLAQLFSLFAALLQAFTQDTQYFLQASPADLPAAFQRMVEHVVEGWGGVVERVGGSVEARLDDARGIVTPARLVVDIPSLPELSSRVLLQAPLPPAKDTAAFTIDKRGVLDGGDITVGDLGVDTRLVVRGADDATNDVRAIARALSTMCLYRPKMTAGTEELVVDVALPAAAAPVVLGAALDAWSELVRARAG